MVLRFRIGLDAYGFAAGLVAVLLHHPRARCQPSLAYSGQINATNTDRTPDKGPPGDDELAALVVELIDEVNSELRSSRWILLNTGSQGVQARVHSGAALWHCCVLLEEIDAVGRTNQELATRILGRSHVEAWVTALFIHYGGFDAVTQVAADLKYNVQAQEREVSDYNRLLGQEIEKATQLNVTIERDNELNRTWNGAHPSSPPRPIRDLVHVPSRPPIGWDMGGWLREVEEVVPKSLPFKQLIAKTNRLLRENEIGEQNLDVVYSVAYRLLSTVGGHASLEVMNGYIKHDRRSTFVRLTHELNSPSFISTIRNTSLMATALVAHRVLDLPGAQTPVAVRILERYESP